LAGEAESPEEEGEADTEEAEHDESIDSVEE